MIDGQQRLTTFQIILCVLRDAFRALSNNAMTDEVESLIFNDDTQEPTERYKLLPREGADRRAFQSLVSPEEVEPGENDEEESISQAHTYFERKIKKYVNDDPEVLQNLYKSVLNHFNVVQIEVGASDEFARIFESINGTGRALSEFDLLRNNLFLRARTAERRDRLYKDYWHIFEKTPWRENRFVDEFLRDFLRVKLGEGFDDQLRLFDSYQQYRMKLVEERGSKNRFAGNRR